MLQSGDRVEYCYPHNSDICKTGTYLHEGLNKQLSIVHFDNEQEPVVVATQWLIKK